MGAVENFCEKAVVRTVSYEVEIRGMTVRQRLKFDVMEIKCQLNISEVTGIVGVMNEEVRRRVVVGEKIGLRGNHKVLERFKYV